MAEENIVIIIHGGVRRFVLATAAINAIKRPHAGGRIVLITSKECEEMARLLPGIDELIIDPLPRLLEIPLWREMTRIIKSLRPAFIYDLQRSWRTNTYFRLLGRRKPQWSGSISWCSHPLPPRVESRLHEYDVLKEQLLSAGVEEEHITHPDISFLHGGASLAPDLQQYTQRNYAMIYPGGSKNDNYRWPYEYFADICNELKEAGVTSLLIGDASDAWICDTIATQCDSDLVVDICGKTSLRDVALLAAGASFAVCNDGAPSQIIHYSDCRQVMLYCSLSPAPYVMARGRNVRLLSDDDLRNIDPQEVMNAVDRWLHVQL